MDLKKLRDARAKIGSIFELTVLLQKRCRELVRGAQKLVDTAARNPIEIALEEVLQGKIWLGARPPGLPEPVVAPAAPAREKGASANNRFA